MSSAELMARIDALIEPYDPAGPWPFEVECEVWALLTQIENSNDNFKGLSK